MQTATAPGLPMARTRRQAAARAARPSAVARAGWFPWLPVWLSLGIGLWFALRFHPGAGSHGIALGLLLLGLALARAAPLWGERMLMPWRLSDALRLGGLALAVAATGFVLAGIRDARVAAPVLGWRYYGPVEGRVVEIDRSARDRLRITLDQVVLRDIAPAATPAHVRLSLTEAPAVLPPPGTRVMLTGHLGPPPGPSSPGSFDFRRQAWFEGLGAIGYTRNPVLTVAPAQSGGVLAMHRLRMQLSAAMQAGIGGQAGAVAAALMTGDRSGIAEATNGLMRDANLYHIVSISGLHMSMLAGFIYGALRLALAALGAVGPGGGWPAHKLAAGVALLGAGVYLWLSGGGVPTERAFVMVAVMLVAIIADRRAISLRTVALAALILLALSPEALTQPGFQMSFAATVALILCIEPWQKVSTRVPRLLRPFAMLVISSAVAGLATAPLAAAQFNRMSEYGLLANLLAVPVMGTLVMPAGVIAALLAPLGLAAPALWVMGLGTQWMLLVAAWISGLDGAVTAVAAPPGAVIPMLGAGGVMLALAAPEGGLLPRWLARAVGAVILVAAIGLWLSAKRPVLLIAPEAEAVGLLTPAGRALSKPTSGGFVATTWLAEDGDTGGAAAAGARPGWSGPKHDRSATLPGGTTIRHLTGKGTAAAVADACAKGGIVVAATKAEATGVACRLFDQRALLRSGAVAIFADGREVSVRDLAGDRSWTGKPPRAVSRRKTMTQGPVSPPARRAATGP